MKLSKIATSVMVAMTLTFSSAVTKSHAQLVTSQLTVVVPVPTGCGDGGCEPKIVPIPTGCGDGGCEPK